MAEWSQNHRDDTDLRYTCPKCKRVFTKPTPDWLCPSCKKTLRILGALKLKDKRQGMPNDDLDDDLESTQF